MTTKDRNQSTEWLESEDALCQEDRIVRIEWLASILPPGDYLLFPGGPISKYLFEEMRYCFVYGQFLASTMLGLAYIEHTLAAKFYAAGRNDLERAGIRKLLEEANVVGMLTLEEVDEIDEIRRNRNPITHFRRPLHEESIEYRSVTANDHPYSLLESDARSVVRSHDGTWTECSLGTRRQSSRIVSG